MKYFGGRGGGSVVFVCGIRCVCVCVLTGVITFQEFSGVNCWLALYLGGTSH